MRVRFVHDESSENPLNVRLTESEICEPMIFSNDKKCIAHLQKINQNKPFSKVKVEVHAEPKRTNIMTSSGGYNNSGNRK